MVSDETGYVERSDGNFVIDEVGDDDGRSR